LVLASSGAPGRIESLDGNKWKNVFDSTTGFVRSIHGQNGGVLWACGNFETGSKEEGLVPLMLIYSQDQGLTWQPHPEIQQDPADLQPWNSLFSLSESELWVVGHRGSYLIWDGSSVTSGFATSSNGTTQNLNGVWGLGAKSIWAVGAGGTILFWNGQGWASVGVPVDSDLHAITSDSAGNLWVVGDNGVILYGQPEAP
jgi:hypothetical protein